jgi:hypothetical protein
MSFSSVVNGVVVLAAVVVAGIRFWGGLDSGLRLAADSMSWQKCFTDGSDHDWPHRQAAVAATEGDDVVDKLTHLTAGR